MPGPILWHKFIFIPVCWSKIYTRVCLWSLSNWKERVCTDILLQYRYNSMSFCSGHVHNSIFIWIEIKRSQGKAGKAGLPWKVCMWLKWLRNMHLKIGMQRTHRCDSTTWSGWSLSLRFKKFMCTPVDIHLFCSQVWGTLNKQY